MIVILVIALVVSSVFKAGTVIIEGMTDKKDDKKKGKKGKEGYENKGKKDKKKKEGFNHEGLDEEREGVDPETEGIEDPEGLDDAPNPQKPCTIDKDCSGGEKCGTSGMCETVV